MSLSQPDRWCGGTDRRAQDENEVIYTAHGFHFYQGAPGYELAGVLSGGEDAEQMDGCVDNDQS